ncbi:MAG: phosphoribosylformylglycinamidine synthase subunit PurQ [Phycisphaeraceae bacterium]|nr:phosphoribosylformylglycinamidine synthase subunit PurQ [Phycisphaeraceae bacterium]
MPTALVVRTAGTNCDAELCRAFELAGARPILVHVDRLVEDPARIDDADLIGFPGGFSHGDDVASGRILAVKLRERLYPALREAARRGVPMIGVCNGFQALVQVGLLPGPSAGANWPDDAPPPQTVALAHNAQARFIDRWVRVRPEPASPCVWTRSISELWREGERDRTLRDDALVLPIAHGEGRFVAASDSVLTALRDGNQIALRYADNPNGSTDDIAGICDSTGRIFGLMPHPERYLDWTLHPWWTRLPESMRKRNTPGLLFFRDAVEAARHAPAAAAR